MKIPFMIALSLCAAAAQAQTWVQQGPGPNTGGQVEGITNKRVVGAIRAVVPHPSDADTLWVGSVNGGIWKTTNATAGEPTWVEQLGLDRSLSIGSLALDPTDETHGTLLAGSGITSAFEGVGGAQVGVWHTTDGGANWKLLDGGGAIANMNVIGVAPRGATMVIAAQDYGIWRSTDTGKTWTKISGAGGSGLPDGTSYDLASDPANPARLFTNAGAQGIYRSTDTGATWQKVSDAAMDTSLTGKLQNVRIAAGRSNEVYVAVVINGQLFALFRSGDGGSTWTALDLPATTENGVAIGIHPGYQGKIDMSIAPHPENANLVFLGGDRQPFRDEGSTNTCSPCFPNSIGATDYTGRLFRVDASQPRGKQSTPITNNFTKSNSSPHADSRNLAFDANGDLLDVDDGGIYRRTAPLTNTGDWVSVIGDLKTTELHSIAYDPNSNLAFGGAQDNGSPEQSVPEGATWSALNTGDGGVVAISGTATPGVSIRYSSVSFLGLFRRGIYDSAGKETSYKYPALTVVGGGARLQNQFYTPIRVNAVDPTRLVIGGANGIYESLDQGDTIRSIATIAVNQSVSNPLAYGAKGNPDVLYAGVGTGVYVRTARTPAAPAQSTTYPGKLKVLDIAIHPLDPKTAYVVDQSTVYVTRDAGATWTDVTRNLVTLNPGKVRSITYSTSEKNDGAIVGTDTGVYIAASTADSWRVLGSGLPSAPVFDLAYDAQDQVLAAGLMGRGAWTIFLGPAEKE